MTEPVASSPRALRIGLLLSLALNALLLAALLAPFALSPREHGHDGHRGRRGGPALMISPHQLKRSLPSAQSALVDAVLATHRPQLRMRIGVMLDARRDVAAALRAEPFDRAALDRAFVALRARENAIAEAAQAMLGDVAAQAGPAGRAQLATLVPERPRHRSGKLRADTSRSDTSRSEQPRSEHRGE